MKLEIITPDKQVFSGKVSSVVVPGKEGSFGILNNHAAIVSSLKDGKVKVTGIDNKTEEFEIKGGVVEVSNNNVTILAQ